VILTAAMAQQARATVDLPVLRRAAAILPNTVNVEARTVDVIWTTGARVLRGFWDRYWEELSTDPKHVRLKRLNNGAPLLNAHDDSNADGVIGVVVGGTAAVDGKRGTATVRFVKAGIDPVADRIFDKVVDGVIQNISVGYATYEMEKIADGADKIPVYRAIDWEPMELSPVPIGADDGAGFRSESTERIKCTFITRQQEQTMADHDPTPTPSGEPAAVAATRAAQQQRVEDAKRDAAIRETAGQQAQVAERQRISEVRKLARLHGMGETWAQNLIDAGTSVDDARAAVLTDLAERDAEVPTAGALRIGAGEDERDKFIRGVTVALIERSGQGEMLERARAKNPKAMKGVETEGGDEFRGYSPLELARLCLDRNRIPHRGLMPLELVGRAFTAVRTGSSNFQSTADFPLILENVLGKVSLGSYILQTNTWEQFCKVEEVVDFRTSNRYRTGSFTGLDVIAEHGEYKTGTIPDASKYSIGTQRFGKMFSISREVIINDDMGALVDIATKIGQASGRTLENAVYALLLLNGGLGPTQADSQPFFHSNRANVSTGAALSVAAIDADRVFMRKQKDPAGLDFLEMMPRVVLVPDELWGQANEINKAEFDFDSSGTAASGKFQRPNRVRGLFERVVSSPRITGTRRYIFGGDLDAIVVTFLGGYGRGPVMETQNGWRVDGAEWKVTLYAKPGMGDPKAALTNAGA
jgi:hypothetical protein